MKKVICAVLAAVVILLPGCGNKAKVEKPEWETQTITEGKLSYELPADWKQTDDPTGQGSLLYIPADADIETGTSNVNVVVMETQQAAPKLSDMGDQFKKLYEEQIHSLFDDATNFVYSSMKAPCGDVFIATYEVTGSMKQTQYYPLVKDCTIVITCTDTGMATTPPVADVANYLVNTVKISK